MQVTAEVNADWLNWDTSAAAASRFLYINKIKFSPNNK